MHLQQECEIVVPMNNLFKENISDGQTAHLFRVLSKINCKWNYGLISQASENKNWFELLFMCLSHLHTVYGNVNWKRMTEHFITCT